MAFPILQLLKIVFGKEVIKKTSLRLITRLKWLELLRYTRRWWTSWSRSSLDEPPNLVLWLSVNLIVCQSTSSVELLNTDGLVL